VTYYTGEKIEIDATLQVDGVAIPVAGLTVSAVLVAPSGRKSSRATCTKPGATGVVRATWEAAESATWTPGAYVLQFWTADGPYCYELPVVVIAKGWSS
jgi:hypothetical protein